MAWSARKRKSVQGYMGALATSWPGTVDVGWRASASWLYAADSYPSPSTPTSALNWSTGLNAGLTGLNIGAKLDIGTGLSLFVNLLFGGWYART